MTIDTVRRSIVNTIASRHVAGRNIEDALRVSRWADRHGFSCIVSPWKGTGDTAEHMHREYKAAIDASYRQFPQSYLSIKLDALDYDTALFDDLLNFARARGFHVHIDSLDPDSADTALAFVERAVRARHSIGCTLPSRWERSLQDATYIAELGIPVRIVKGQWPDLLGRNMNATKNYVEIARRLAGKSRIVRIATHDTTLAGEVLEELSAANTPCEVEQFFTLPLNGSDLARKFGYPYRIYVAYGNPGLPYNVRFTLTRPRIAAWMLTDFALNRKRPWLEERV